MQLRFDTEGLPCVEVRVDGKELLPRQSSCSPTEAMEYLKEVLVDFRAGDQITLLAGGAATELATCTASTSFLALEWCANALSEAFYHLGLGSGSPLPKPAMPLLATEE